jgi:hypothetical protein
MKKLYTAQMLIPIHNNDDQVGTLPEDSNQSVKASIINNNGMSPTQRPTVDPNYVQTSPELINHIIDEVIKSNSSNNQKVIEHEALSTIDNPHYRYYA